MDEDLCEYKKNIDQELIDLKKRFLEEVSIINDELLEKKQEAQEEIHDLKIEILEKQQELDNIDLSRETFENKIQEKNEIIRNLIEVIEKLSLENIYI